MGWVEEIERIKMKVLMSSWALIGSSPVGMWSDGMAVHFGKPSMHYCTISYCFSTLLLSNYIVNQSHLFNVHGHGNIQCYIILYISYYF